MLFWSSPLWFTALAIVPAIRWLHLLHFREKAISVSGILFWKTGGIPPLSYKPSVKADPIWRLRALIAALIILALCGPVWRDASRVIVRVWFDDSMSMQTEEDGGTRADLAIAELFRRIEPLKSARLIVRSLSDPARQPLIVENSAHGITDKQLSDWLESGSGNKSFVSPLILDSDTENWLITDGADDRLNQRASEAGFDRIIRVGALTDNSAVTLLSIRQTLQDPLQWNGLIEIRHFGLTSARRRLELAAGPSIVGQWELDLEPEQIQYIEFNLKSAAAEELEVRLIPGDPLIQDDRLSLTTETAIATRVYGACSPPLIAAVKAHPNLTLTDGRSIEPLLNIVCGNETIAAQNPVIRFHGDQAKKPIDSLPLWLEDAQSLNGLFLPYQQMVYVESTAVNEQTPILAVGSTTLISVDGSGARTVNCFIDMSRTDFAQRPEFPVLFSGLVDLALNKPVLNSIRTNSRNAGESRIKPLPINQASSPSDKKMRAESIDLVPYVLTLAIFLLGTDAILSRKNKYLGSNSQ